MARGLEIETIIELFCKAKNFSKYRNNHTLLSIMKTGKSSDHALQKRMYFLYKPTYFSFIFRGKLLVY